MGWLSFLDFLVEPRFIDRRRPPLGVAAPATIYGWIVFAISLFFLIALFLVGVPSALLTLRHGHAGIFVLAAVGFVLLVIAQLMMLIGAWQMTRGARNGRRLLIQGLVLSVAFSLIYNIGLANIPQFILQLVIRAILYYFAVVSRFPDEAASTTS